MNEKSMILEALEKATNPMMAKDIVKYVYIFFDGYKISKKDVKVILWGELKNDVIFNKVNYTYALVNQKLYSKPHSTELQILDDIKEALSLIENPNDLTVQKITNILNYSLFKQYNLYDIRKVFNKHDIAIFEQYNKINFEKQHHKKIDQTHLDDIDLPNLKVNKYHLDGYNLIIGGASNELGPLFWVKAEGLNINIYINILHPKFQKEKEEFIAPMIVAIVRTSLSFSDNNGEIFINRFKNYLELV